MGRRRNRDPTFFAGAVFARSAPITTSAEELRSTRGIELASALGSPVGDERTAAELRGAAKAILHSYLRVVLDDEQDPTVRMETGGVVSDTDPAQCTSPGRPLSPRISTMRASTSGRRTCCLRSPICASPL